MEMHAPRRKLPSDVLWLIIWLGGLSALWVWNTLFLNDAAFANLRSAALNTLLVGLCVVVLAFVLGWMGGVGAHLLQESRFKAGYFLVTFLFNIVRSVPQIIGVLLGYVVLTILIREDILRSSFSQLMWMAGAIALMVFLEVADLIRERIRWYQQLDFYDAMLVCGISEGRIINTEILWKNSRAHLLHKMISVFGGSVFLLCSIDFIISVGLSTDVSLSNFPTTLGGLLAKLDSKQDILAISTVFSNPSNITTLFFQHLQGISTALLIVFTLLCLYNISNGIVRRHRL